MLSHSTTATATCATEQQTSWLLQGRIREDESMRQVRIDASPFQVGRKAGIPLCLGCPVVSGIHAEFTIEDSELYLRDLGSTNGTFVNGVRLVGKSAVQDGDLVQFADIVFRVCSQSAVEEVRTMQEDAGDRALALIQFDKLINERAVVPYFQPVIALADDTTIGYEVLARSRLYGLSEPKAMFHAASVLDLESELSRIFREEGVKASLETPGKPEIFLNTHPCELDDHELMLLSMRELREAHPAQQLVLEIHEAAITRPAQMREVRLALWEMGVKLAYDDFGAGQTRLAELIDVPPDYLKFDLKFMREIEQAPRQRLKMLQEFISMLSAEGVASLAEGVETEEADAICRDIGFEYGQGYFYGRPAVVQTYAKDQ